VENSFICLLVLPEGPRTTKLDEPQPTPPSAPLSCTSRNQLHLPYHEGIQDPHKRVRPENAKTQRETPDSDLAPNIHYAALRAMVGVVCLLVGVVCLLVEAGCFVMF
jgi:hypothetical protein